MGYFSITCARRGEVDSSEIHFVKTACLCMSLLTTRLQFGGAACSANSVADPVVVHWVQTNPPYTHCTKNKAKLTVDGQ